MGIDSSPMDLKSGKKIQHMGGIDSSNNLLYGNYGTDPISNLDSNYKPYSKSVNRSIANH
jgi:hypothetical protein